VVSTLTLVDDLERAVRSIPGVRRVDALLLVATALEPARHRELADPAEGQRSFVPR
jgi:hypothetical protein